MIKINKKCNPAADIPDTNCAGMERKMKKRLSKKRRHFSYINKWLQNGLRTGKRCETCGEYHIFLFEFDAICCPVCNIWIDEKCGDPQCYFCAARPDTPAEGLIKLKPVDLKSIYIKRYERSHKARYQAKNEDIYKRHREPGK